MRLRPLSLILVLILGVFQVSGQGTTISIVGSWYYKGDIEQGDKVGSLPECPDMIEFKSNGSYVVYNDCYGPDAKNPVVERGKWEVNKPLNKLILKERSFAINYTLYSSDKKIELDIIALNANTMKVRFGKEGVELYTKENK